MDRVPALHSVTPDEGPLAVPAPPHLAMPAATRVLRVRVVCLRASDARSSVSLAVGERGCDPDVVFPADLSIAVVETQLSLVRTSARGFGVDGRYLVGGHRAPALELRWGVSSPRGHFLLMSGLHLRLPQLHVRADRPRSGTRIPVLTTTAAVTDPEGTPLRGAVEADDLAWQLSFSEMVTPATTVLRPRFGTA